jgi:Ca-activated chloride channel family protein
MNLFESQATSLVTNHGQSIPLQGVRAQGRLDGLVFTLEVEQRYQNPLPDSVEAVYTFPLPSRAVLLALELEVGGQKLAAIAAPKAEAKRRYEAAIDNGDTTVLLEHNGHGLYTVSLGHLRAGEAATIRYRYVELLDAFEGFVRLAVPTVIAPRYGDPAAAGLSGPAVPANSFLAEYPFDIEILLAGLANDAGLRSPSHATHAVATAEGLRVTLRRQGFLDKDFVLQLQAASLPQRALVARDGEGWAVLASPAYATAAQPDGPFTVKVLLDCSGSMGGERIENAKRALSQFLRNLSVEDRFSLTCFGSSHQHITAGLETLDKAVREALLLRVRDIDA